jgi:hypothetical protein
MKRNLAVVIFLLALAGCGEKAPQMTCAQMIAEVGRVDRLLDSGEEKLSNLMSQLPAPIGELCALARADIKLADDYARLYKANKDQCTELIYQMTIRGNLNIEATLSREAFKQGLCK